ncbi:MAG: hypothetical protein EBU15_14310 [Betaproteobacteria bacterium]|nr:hypothetical protein [Betaproteobacteria bacterium]
MRANPGPIGLPGNLVAAGQAVGPGLDGIGGEGIGASGTGEGDGVKIPVGRVNTRGVADRLGIRGGGRKDAVVDAVAVGVGAGPVAVVEVGPKLDLAGGNARGEGDGDRHGIIADLVDVEFAGRVIGVESASRGRGDGERGGGHRGGDIEGEGAGGGGSLRRGGGGAPVIVNVGWAGDGGT